MYRQLNIKEFIQVLGNELLQSDRVGVIFLVGSSGAWGKLMIRKGDIESLTFHSHKGNEALPLLKKQPKIQFLFQEQKSNASKTSALSDAQLTNKEFFDYFGMPEFIRSQHDVHDDWDIDFDVTEINELPSASKAKILVVDDSSTARKSVRLVLENAGFAVAEAKDGLEALGQLQNENPQLVLLDLVMPGIDGYRVLEMIRGNPKYKKLPVIMLTSRDGVLDKLKGAASSLNEYMTKPFVPENLVGIIVKYIN